MPKGSFFHLLLTVSTGCFTYLQPSSQGPSLTVIFSVALVVITLSAVATFYALEAIKNSGSETSTATTTSTVNDVTNETVSTVGHLDAAETEANSVADLLDEPESTFPTETT
ncbi:hypothetical protein HPB50_014669 [Hyalomma asiaticum]|uniref:Uncharacterized protein n=1 Tax=Hyalomma asiaticum TaxID=266040 RepID=A0ACB7S5T1_HYAAI|nr:hypothetical protein HPB50_014669 [Hyalomma asiaticum]